MAQGPEDKGAESNRWKYPVAAVVIVGFLGLVIYQTVRTGDVPYTIAVPLLVASLVALLNFKMSDWK